MSLRRDVDSDDAAESLVPAARQEHAIEIGARDPSDKAYGGGQAPTTDGSMNPAKRPSSDGRS